MDVVGIGRDVGEAFGPAVTDLGGTVVATIGATVADLDPTADPTGQWAATATTPGTADAVDPARLLRAVERADASADVVVVYMHWGVQGERCPSATSARSRRAWSSAARTSSSAATPTSSRAAARSVTATWPTGSATTPGTSPPSHRRAHPHRRAAESPGGRATVTEAWEPARIGADGLPVVVAGSGRLDPPGYEAG